LGVVAELPVAHARDDPADRGDERVAGGDRSPAAPDEALDR